MGSPASLSPVSLRTLGTGHLETGAGISKNPNLQRATASQRSQGWGEPPLRERRRSKVDVAPLAKKAARGARFTAPTRAAKRASAPAQARKGGESPPSGARLPAAGKRPPNSRPLQTSAAKPQKGGRELLRPLPARVCTIKRSPTKTSAQKTERTHQARRAIGGQAQPAREALANRTPAGCRSADPQKVGGAPRPSRGRLRPSGQCEHVLHAREKKQAYGLVPAEGKK